MVAHQPVQTVLGQFGIFLTLKFPVPVCVAFGCTVHSTQLGVLQTLRRK